MNIHELFLFSRFVTTNAKNEPKSTPLSCLGLYSNIKNTGYISIEDYEEENNND